MSDINAIITTMFLIIKRKIERKNLWLKFKQFKDTVLKRILSVVLLRDTLHQIITRESTGSIFPIILLQTLNYKKNPCFLIKSKNRSWKESTNKKLIFKIFKSGRMLSSKLLPPNPNKIWRLFPGPSQLSW